MGRILVIDKEPYVPQFLMSILELDKHSVWHAEGIDEARQRLADQPFDVILSDYGKPDGEGLAILTSARECDSRPVVVFLSAEASLDMAVESMRRGAFDFLTKPFSAERLRTAVQRACEHTQASRQNGHAAARANLGWIEALPPSFDLRRLLSTVEKAVIERTLQATCGAQAEAARRLGLSRSDLSYKLLKYDLRKETTVS